MLATLISLLLLASSATSSDVLPLLSFKSAADPHHRLRFPLHSHYCQWQGVTCLQGRVIRLVLEGAGLAGAFTDSLARLDQLRVLSLQNNSLTGPIPDLSNLTNLKTLFLSRNSFSGHFPPSLLSLHRIRTLDLSRNNLSGPLPPELTQLDRLNSLHLEWNHFRGSLPPLNQTSLQSFNVSGNNLAGAVPATVLFSRLDASCFSWNPGLCGEIVNRECDSKVPFFRPSLVTPPPPPPVQISQSEQLTGKGGGGAEGDASRRKKKHRIRYIIGYSLVSMFVLIGFVFVLLAFFSSKKVRNQKGHRNLASSPLSDSGSAMGGAEVVMRVEEEEKELELKVKKMQGMQLAKSGNLMFCAGETQVYSLDQLMRASAEMLGRGSIGTTYKAILDNELVVTVKRLDAVKTAVASKEMFQRHLEAVGSLRHPNLVPIRAYFQAKEERLIVYDYQSNGSLFSLVHGKTRL